VHAATDSEADLDAARWLDGFFNRWYLDPIFLGRYPVDAIADRVALGHLEDARLPFVQDGDMELISTPLDFLGVNYYSRALVEAGPDGRPVDVKRVAPEELTEMGWEVYPEGLEQGLSRIHRDYRPREIYVTENGAAFPDPDEAEGRIRDWKRVHYLREHLRAAHDAIAKGVPLRGYFAWSLMDNFEWGQGYEKRFGLFAVDYDTQRRIPKDSARWYRDLISTNSIDPDFAVETQGESRVSESQS
jgi:beta-glucosidase